jgi:Tol biopolymer transport system component
MEVFTHNLVTGERVIVASNDWLNHVQFSPTDPGLIMYCHEGPWHEVDRIWTIRTDGSNKKLVHSRTMNNEIAGHEFFSPDGETIWYDLQTPRGQVFWLAGYNVRTGKRTWYHVERNQWSVHYNQSPDFKLFSGDGGDSEMVAHAPDGKWLYLFTPRMIGDDAEIPTADADKLIVPGTFDQEKLVDMHANNYKTEPNMTFTPDGKWIIFARISKARPILMRSKRPRQQGANIEKSAWMIALLLATPAHAGVARSWAVAMQATPPADSPGAPPSIADATVRQIVRLSAGGTRLRVALDNSDSATSLAIKHVTVAMVDAKGAIVPGTMRNIAFGGRAGSIFPPMLR